MDRKGKGSGRSIKRHSNDNRKYLNPSLYTRPSLLFYSARYDRHDPVGLWVNSRSNFSYPKPMILNSRLEGEVLYRDDNMVLVLVVGEDAPRRWRSLSSGYYLRNNKGYWYSISPEWGHLYRMRYKKQYRLLEELANDN